jgi:hypothetical protein
MDEQESAAAISSDTAEPKAAPAISAMPNGPLVVTGGLPLYRRRAVHSEHGEPLT